MDHLTIRTSEHEWLKTLSQAYQNKQSILLIDDAKIGVDPFGDSIFQMALRAKLSPREIAAVSVSLGMSVVGVSMIALAFIDPEPTSKLGLLVGGGVATFMLGGSSALYILVKLKPPKITIKTTGEFVIEWQ
jgi:hypothetical protein